MKEMAGRLEINYQSLRHYQSVAERYELCTRVHNLSFKHHQIAEKAKANQISNLKNQNIVSQNSDKREINTKKELAKMANVSHDTIAKVKVIEQEARLGELIKVEQEAGRLAVGTNNLKQYRGNNDVTSVQTLADYGLTKIESSRAQELAEHQDIIAEKAKANQGTRNDITSVRNLTNVDTKKELAKMASVSHARLHQLHLPVALLAYTGSKWSDILRLAVFTSCQNCNNTIILLLAKYTRKLNICRQIITGYTQKAAIETTAEHLNVSFCYQGAK